MTILDLIRGIIPTPPWLGPPLPQGLGILWPWLQMHDLVPTESAMTTYDNTEEIELLDIDPDLLMPRKIIVHRKAKVLR